MKKDTLNQMAKDAMPIEQKANRDAKLRENQSRILNEAWKVAQQRWEEEGGAMEVTIWDINQVFKNIPDLIEEISQDAIEEGIFQGKRWLLKQKNQKGLWGWWGPLFDPPQLKYDFDFSKIWSTAITIRALVRNGHPVNSPEVIYGIKWLLENKTPVGGWGRLPQNYARDYEYLSCIPSPYETSCVLLTLLEARELVPTDCIAEVVHLIEEYQRPGGDWPLEFTSRGKENLGGDIGATALILGALSRTKMGDPLKIKQGIKWLIDAQNVNGGWGFTSNSPSITTKTCDVLRALLEAGVGPEEKCIRQGAYWLHKNQGPTGDNSEGWGWGTVGINGTIVASNIQNTAFVITALLRAGFSQRIPSIQAALRWIITSMGDDAWCEDTPRVILSLHECLLKTENTQ